MTLHEAIRHGEGLLRAAGVEDPGWNAERLLLKAARISRAAAYANLQREINKDEWTIYEGLLERRARHEPLAYIEGTQEFYGREFYVDHRVLIPRPETEEIIRAALQLQLPAEPRILDLGAGSGCIAVTLALELSGSRVFALELSPAAIPVLFKNGDGKIQVARGSLFAPPFRRESFDLIVSNPPYVEEKDYAGLPAETLHEPREALVPASLDAVFLSLMNNATLLLKHGGFLIFEIGAGQGPLVEDLLMQHRGVSKLGSRSDFRGLLRTIVLQKT